MDEDSRHAAQNSASRHGPRGLDVYVRSRGLQPGQDAKSDGGSRVKAGKMPGQMLGRANPSKQDPCFGFQIH